MSNLEIWLLAVSLAMDCFSVSITSGIILRRVCMKVFLTIAFFFGLFQGMMPVIGWFGASRFYHLIEQFDHWIAFALLIFLGVKMIREGISDDEEHLFDPTRLATVLTLSLAVSIDALAVGISFTCIGMSTLHQLTFPLLAIGLASFVLALIGCFIGSIVGSKLRFPMEPIGGLVLIILGIKILFEHLTMC